MNSLSQRRCWIRSSPSRTVGKIFSLFARIVARIWFRWYKFFQSRLFHNTDAFERAIQNIMKSLQENTARKRNTKKYHGIDCCGYIFPIIPLSLRLCTICTTLRCLVWLMFQRVFLVTTSLLLSAIHVVASCYQSSAKHSNQSVLLCSLLSTFTLYTVTQ